MLDARAQLRVFMPLLRYPREDYVEQLHGAMATCERDLKVTRHLEILRKFTADLTQKQLFESYTAVFDINPAVTLDVGFHLFGLQYQRGAFLVKISGALRRYGIDPAPELPDHLPLLLDLATRLPEDEGVSLIEEVIAPCVSRMRLAFAEDHPGFGQVLQALHAHLDANFDCVLMNLAKVRETLHGAK